MISHKHKCIFIHIPKCAGTSIEKKLGHFDEYDGRGRQDHRTFRMMQSVLANLPSSFSSKENIKEVLKKLRLGIKGDPNPQNLVKASESQVGEYYKFTVVRNPWDRAYSWYKNVVRDEIHQRNYGIRGDISFEDFLAENVGNGYLHPQLYWLKNFAGKIDMDFVAKFENLESDFQQIALALKLETDDLPKETHGSSKQSSITISRKAKQIIDSFYDEEIKMFSYDFETHCSMSMVAD